MLFIDFSWNGHTFCEKSVSFSLFRPFREALPGVARFLHQESVFYISNTIGFEVLDFEDFWGGPWGASESWFRETPWDFSVCEGIPMLWYSVSSSHSTNRPGPSPRFLFHLMVASSFLVPQSGSQARTMLLAALSRFNGSGFHQPVFIVPWGILFFLGADVWCWLGCRNVGISGWNL